MSHTRKTVGIFSTIGYIIDTVGQSAKACSDIAYAGQTFTDGLPQLAESSSELLNYQATSALAEQKALMAEQAKAK